MVKLQKLRRTKYRLLGLALLVAYILSVVLSPQIFAKSLDNRSLVTGSQLPSAVTTHNFSFFVQSLPNIGSIVFEYCANSPVFTEPCDAPAGLNVAGASLTFQNGNTGFSFDNAHSSSNKIVITRPISAAAVIQSNYNFANVVNPSASGEAVYVRISTRGTTDGSGAFIDNGAVAFATNSAFSVGAFVPPFMEACVGITVTANCSSSTGTLLDLGTLSANKTAVGTSQFAVATNSLTGVAVYALGGTLTAGNNEIDALGQNSFSAPGLKQFGVNLRANVLPQVGAEPSGTGSASPTAPYGSINQFRFVSGEMVANSPEPTDYRTFTVSYIANIPSNMPGGYYATSITYLAAAEF